MLWDIRLSLNRRSAFEGVCYERFGRAVLQREQPPLKNRQG